MKQTIEEIKADGVSVRCTHCGEVYDLTRVVVIHRHADCTVFRAPCCQRRVDDRTWKSMPDIERNPKQWSCCDNRGEFR